MANMVFHRTYYAHILRNGSFLYLIFLKVQMNYCILISQTQSVVEITVEFHCGYFMIFWISVYCRCEIGRCPSADPIHNKKGGEVQLPSPGIIIDWKNLSYRKNQSGRTWNALPWRPPSRKRFYHWISFFEKAFFRSSNAIGKEWVASIFLVSFSSSPSL